MFYKNDFAADFVIDTSDTQFEGSVTAREALLADLGLLQNPLEKFIRLQIAQQADLFTQKELLTLLARPELADVLQYMPNLQSTGRVEQQPLVNEDTILDAVLSGNCERLPQDLPLDVVLHINSLVAAEIHAQDNWPANLQAIAKHCFGANIEVPAEVGQFLLALARSNSTLEIPLHISSSGIHFPTVQDLQNQLIEAKFA